MLIVLINDSLDCAVPMVSGTIWTEKAMAMRRLKRRKSRAFKTNRPNASPRALYRQSANGPALRKWHW